MCYGGAMRAQTAMVGQRGRAMPAVATMCPQSPGKIHHISNSPTVRRLVRSPVATYGLCFQI
jgi:hypothetical protein